MIVSNTILKKCSKCNIEKSITDYHKRIYKTGTIGFQPICKDCRKVYNEENKERLIKYRTQYKIDNQEKIKESKKRYADNNKDKISKQKKIYTANTKEHKREYDQKRTYGISRKKMLESQNNKCKICNIEFDFTHPKLIHTDHNHSNGKVRGILCHHCNQILKGKIKDKDVCIEILNNSIIYLNKPETDWKYYDGHQWKNKLKNKDKYEFLLKKNDGKCEICNIMFTTDIKQTYENYYIFPNIDHNKKTGMIRGLLCTYCNKLLGNAKDNIEILYSVIEYLRNYK